MSATASRPVLAVPTGKQLRRLTKLATSNHTGGSIASLLGDVYIAVFTAAITVGMAWGGLQAFGLQLRGEAVQARLNGPTVATLLVAAVFSITWSVSARLGPVALGGGQAAWWLPTPVDRRGLLGSRGFVAVLIAAAIGAAGGFMAAAVDQGAPAGWLFLGAAATALVVALSAYAQTTASARFLNRALILVADAVLALVPVLAFIAAATGGGLGQVPDGPTVAVAAGLGALAVALSVAANLRAERISGVLLRERGAVAAHAQGAAESLDTRELGRALSLSSQRDTRRSRAFAWVGGPVMSIAAGAATTTWRSPRHLVQWLVSACLPLICELAGAPVALTAVALVFAGLLAVTALCEAARQVQMSPGIERLWPLPARVARRSQGIWPLVAMTVWTAVVFSVLGHLLSTGGNLAVDFSQVDVAGAISWLLMGLAAGAAFAGAGVRGAFRKGTDWSAPLVATPAGAIPSGIISGLARGPEVAVIALVPTYIAFAAGTLSPLLILLQALLSWAAFWFGTRLPAAPGQGILERANATQGATK